MERGWKSSTERNRWTVGQREGKIETRGGEVERKGRNRGRVRAGRTGEGVSYNILGARDVDNITGKLRDIGKMALLSGGPRR